MEDQPFYLGRRTVIPEDEAKNEERSEPWGMPVEHMYLDEWCCWMLAWDFHLFTTVTL